MEREPTPVRSSPPGRASRRPTRRAPLDPATALLPLRAFLGVTFVYAGLQKLSDPGFLHKGAPTYIGSQLHAFANGTPGGFILNATALHFPAFAGICVALAEIMIGLLVLIGLMTRVAAGAGLGLNLLLFLTASWKTYPYFLGADIVFVFAWLPFVLAGATGQPALDNLLARRALAQPSAASLERSRPATARRRQPLPERHTPVTRRAVFAQALGATGLAALVLGGIASALKGSYRGRTVNTLASGTPPKRAARGAAHRTHRSSGASTHSTGGRSAAPPPGAVRLGPSSRLPRGQAALYPDPQNGEPDIIVRLSDGSLAAHNAICTHAGCEVSYEQGTLVCPCHGSVFNAVSGAVEQGPAVQPLPARRVIERGGQIYAL